MKSIKKPVTKEKIIELTSEITESDEEKQFETCKAKFIWAIYSIANNFKHLYNICLNELIDKIYRKHCSSIIRDKLDAINLRKHISLRSISFADAYVETGGNDRFYDHFDITLQFKLHDIFYSAVSFVWDDIYDSKITKTIKIGDFKI